MFGKIKDIGVSKAASAWLENKIGNYAEVKFLKIDSHAKQISLIIRPKGEELDVELKVEAYAIETRSGQHFFKVHEVSSSREWLTKLAENYIVGNEYNIPSIAALAL